MDDPKTIVAIRIGGAIVLVVATLYLATHYQTILQRVPPVQTGAEGSASLTIPTVDQMCMALGAVPETMAQCRADEEAAGEFVIAWMGLNGFIVDGAIDIAQIQVAASLGPDLGADPGLQDDPSLGLDLADPSLLSDPNFDPSLLDPSLLGDPSLDPTAQVNIDPSTGLPVEETFGSMAEIALTCLSQASDWIGLYECIYRYDPTSRFSAN